VAAGSKRAAADVHLDVVPVREGVEDRGSALGIGLAQIAERLVGEDDTPAERVVRSIALDHRDAMSGVLPLHEEREIQSRRPAADADDVHGSIV